VREFLTREEDTIVFSLIERARYPLNRPAYDTAHLGAAPGRRHNASFVELFVRESEAIQSKVRFFIRPRPVYDNSLVFLFEHVRGC
jgi:chorismate mutase